jgi:hypothetical protein
MSSTYTYNPSNGTLKDKVRLLIPDRPISRENDPAVFSDEEITLLASMHDNDPYLTAAAACEVIAMDRAKQAISFSINGMSVSKTSVPTFFMNRAKELKTQVGTEPWEDISSVDYTIGPFGEDRSSYVGDEDEGE